jgi:hypothetical protein
MNGGKGVRHVNPPSSRSGFRRVAQIMLLTSLITFSGLDVVNQNTDHQAIIGLLSVLLAALELFK